MAFTAMTAWDVGYGVHKGEKVSAPYHATPASREFSVKNAEDMKVLLAQIVATLDEIKGQL